MSTILETLENARYNLITNKHIPFAHAVGESQLNGAVVLLQKGYDINIDIDDFLEKYDNIMDVPEINQK